MIWRRFLLVSAVLGGLACERSGSPPVFIRLDGAQISLVDSRLYGSEDLRPSRKTPPHKYIKLHLKLNLAGLPTDELETSRGVFNIRPCDTPSDGYADGSLFVGYASGEGRGGSRRDGEFLGAPVPREQF